MNKGRIFFVIVGLGLLLGQSARASHIYGGNLSMTQVDKKAGLFRIAMHLFVDAMNTQASEDEYLRGTYFSLVVFEKKTNTRIEEIEVTAGPANQLIYDNTSCAAKHGFKTRIYTYASDVKLDLKKYVNPDGYYLVWERCCRPGLITNLSDPGNAGLALYLEFPALVQNQEPITYSSPRFRIPDGNYACVNKMFYFNFSAVDEDGDELKYSLVTPWRGHNDEINFDAVPRPAPYPEANWNKGFSTQVVIPGNPALTINAGSGVAQVKASMLGVFAIAIQCEKIRNGKTIGIIRQDFQIPVIDCVVETPPVAKIENQGIQASQLFTCGNQSITLSLDEDGPYNYQWKHNNLNMTGATARSVVVSDTGSYTVLKSYSNRCAGDTLSQAVHISFPAIRFENENKKICSIDSFTLRIASLPSYQVQWLYKNQVVATGPTFAGKGVGTYQVVAKSSQSSCPYLSDSVTIEELPPPLLPANYVTNYLICPEDSVEIGAAPNAGYHYSWDTIKSISSRVVVNTPGEYLLTIKDVKTGCTTKAPPVQVVQKTITIPTINPIPLLCAARGNTVTLSATPNNGIFQGRGINENRFNPLNAGVGTHEIRYSTFSENCPVYASQFIEVVKPFELQVPATITLSPGSSVRLQAQASEEISVEWYPSEGLSSTRILQPLSTPEKSIVYHLTATASNGCKVIDSVRIQVGKRMYIPTAFSPNQDGQNDTWEIKNTHLFPDCEVMVFNRWGESIYHSKGAYQAWDGKFQNGTPAPPGVYSYQIKINDGTDFAYRGILNIIY